MAAVADEQKKAEILQREIWREAVRGCQEIESPAVTTLVLNSVNEMIDMARTRNEGTQLHPPSVIHVLLIILVLTSSVLTGNAMAASKIHNWVHILGFTIMLSAAVVVILDLEYPRIGAIRIDDWDRVLIALRASMK
jgi:hypothetical protein